VLNITFESGLQNVLDQFDAFIIDQWGVLHDGAAPYTGVAKTMAELQQRNFPVAILTNSSKLEQPNLDRLDRLGLPASLYGPVVSTADLLKAHIVTQPRPLRVFLVATGIDAQMFEGTDVIEVETPEEADCVVLLTITDEVAADPSQADWLERAIACNLMLHTPSADVQSVTPGGSVVYGFSRLVTHYEKMGGTVRLHGKPSSECYDACRSRLGLSPSARVAAIGDQFETDVLGAVRNDCTPILVETGAAERTKGVRGVEDWSSFLHASCKDGDVSRLIVLPALAW
jgi:HAD superfamily hydrolase (TIGR01459 family)